MASLVRRALPHARELAGLARCVAHFPTGLLEPAPRYVQTTDRLTTPVVLVHGYGHNRSAWRRLERELRVAGFDNIVAENHNPILHDVERLAVRLAAAVDDARAATGSERVHVVGHSLGGLVLRAYVQLFGGDESVATAVTIATPHAGTHVARLGFGATASQLRPGSEILERLTAAARPSPVRWVTYSSTADLLVRPVSSGRLDDPVFAATNFVVHGTGHLGLLVSGRIASSIADELVVSERDRTRRDASLAAALRPGA